MKHSQIKAQAYIFCWFIWETMEIKFVWISDWFSDWLIVRFTHSVVNYIVTLFAWIVVQLVISLITCVVMHLLLTDLFFYDLTSATQLTGHRLSHCSMDPMSFTKKTKKNDIPYLRTQSSYPKWIITESNYYGRQLPPLSVSIETAPVTKGCRRWLCVCECSLGVHQRRLHNFREEKWQEKWTLQICRNRKPSVASPSLIGNLSFSVSLVEC